MDFKPKNIEKHKNTIFSIRVFSKMLITFWIAECYEWESGAFYVIWSLGTNSIQKARDNSLFTTQRIACPGRLLLRSSKSKCALIVLFKTFFKQIVFMKCNEYYQYPAKGYTDYHYPSKIIEIPAEVIRHINPTHKVIKFTSSRTSGMNW